MQSALLLAAWLVALLFAGCGGQDPIVTDSQAPSAAAPWFEELGAAAGIDFIQDSGAVPGRYLMPEIVCGGGALLDVDGDGRLDLYLVQSGSLTEPGGARAANRLYRNITEPGGPPRFEEVTEGSGADDRGYGMGVATGDFDGDGDTDLYITNLGPDALLRNDGGLHFTDVTSQAGLGHTSWGTSASFGDLDADGDLDLYVTTYLAWELSGEVTCYNKLGAVDYCPPKNYLAPALDVLYENLGDGTFRDVSVESGITARPGYGLGVLCEDFDGDGALDFFVANDSLGDWLWRNEGGLVFEDIATRVGCAVDQYGIEKAGMGVAAADLDDDGSLDLLVCNLDEQTDSLYTWHDGRFRDRTLVAGLGLVSRRYTRFGVGWADFNLDGKLDLYEACGRVNMRADESFAEPNLLLRGGASGKFEEVLPRGGTNPELIATSRAALFGDLDNDGGVDIVIVNRDGPAHVLHNIVAGRGQWLGLQVLETSGAAAIGAKVTCQVGARKVTRRVHSDSSYLAANDPRIVLGLGGESGVSEVVVTWVDGQSESFGGLGAGSYHVLRRGEGR